MPHKGLPRCGCGRLGWLPLAFAERSARMKCRHCGGERRTRSVRGLRQLKELLGYCHMIWKVGDRVWWPSAGRVRCGVVEGVLGPSLKVLEGNLLRHEVAIVACCHGEDAARELMRAWATAPGPKKPHHKYRSRR